MFILNVKEKREKWDFIVSHIVKSFIHSFVCLFIRSFIHCVCHLSCHKKTNFYKGMIPSAEDNKCKYCSGVCLRPLIRYIVVGWALLTPKTIIMERKQPFVNTHVPSLQFLSIWIIYVFSPSPRLSCYFKMWNTRFTPLP